MATTTVSHCWSTSSGRLGPSSGSLRAHPNHARGHAPVNPRCTGSLTSIMTCRPLPAGRISFENRRPGARFRRGRFSSRTATWAAHQRSWRTGSSRRSGCGWRTLGDSAVELRRRQADRRGLSHPLGTASCGPGGHALVDEHCTCKTRASSASALVPAGTAPLRSRLNPAAMAKTATANTSRARMTHARRWTPW